MEKYKLVVLTPAQLELEEITTVHLNLAGADSAIKIANKILNTLEHLESFPLLGPLHQDNILKNQGYRILVIDKYICVYRVLETNIYVYHIVYGSTDYPKLFKESEKDN